MKIGRYATQDGIHYGVMRDDGGFDRIEGGPYDAIRIVRRDDPATVTLLCPVEAPRIFGVGYNYRAHTAETQKEQPILPCLFMKPSTSAIGPDEAIIYPDGGEIVHFEGELCAIIGKKGRHITKDTALSHVLGYTCGNDVSDRVVQRQESKFGALLAGKAYDTFAPLGPVIETDLDPTSSALITRQNGIVKQSGNTRDLVFAVADLVSYLSRFVTLLPGDVIMTGTPAGVGNIAVGDTIEVEIPGIGILRNPVSADNKPR